MTNEAQPKNPLPAWEDMDLATRIRVLAAVRGVSLAVVARASGLHRMTLDRLVHGKGTKPTLDTARRLATAFELEHVEDLVP